MASGYAYRGPGDFVLVDPAVGLDRLDAYLATLTVTFDGTASGGTRWTSTTSLDHSRDPSITALTVTHAGDLAPADPSLQAELGDTSYVVTAHPGCIATPLDPASAIRPRLEPARVLSGVIGAEAAGHRSVDGVEADGYTFGEAALGLEGVADGSGEVWVASDGGYVVEYVLSLDAGPPVLGEATAGTMTWDYELTRTGEPVAIDLPADCPTGSIGAPVMPDASDVASGPTLLAYTTRLSLAEVVAFYRKAGKAARWTFIAKPAVMGDTALIAARADRSVLTILATRQGATGTTTVEITIDAASR
jgi:hypothetical protein